MLQVLAVAVHNHYKRLQNKRMHRAQEAQLQQQAAMVSCSRAGAGTVLCTKSAAACLLGFSDILIRQCADTPIWQAESILGSWVDSSLTVKPCPQQFGIGHGCCHHLRWTANRFEMWLFWNVAVC